MDSEQTEIRQKFHSLRSTEDLAVLLDVSQDRLRWHSVRSNSDRRYRRFTIPKKGGGERVIFAPNPGLKLLQAKVNNVLQEVYRPRPSTFGFVRRRNVKMNAQRHVGQRWVFNIDLLDFFPSINFGRVRGMLINKPYELPESVATTLAQICCHGNGLPQGAPTSPVLSNMICRRLDYELQALAVKHRPIYTRYADDMTFSSKLPTFPEAIAQAESIGGTAVEGQDLVAIIEDNGFAINPAKTRLQRYNRRQSVTGLVVNSKVNVPRAYVRGLRGMLHPWEKYGLAAAQRTYEQRHFRQEARVPVAPTPKLSEVIWGKIAYLGLIRGKGDLLYIRYKEWFGTLDPSS